MKDMKDMKEYEKEILRKNINRTLKEIETEVKILHKQEGYIIDFCTLINTLNIMLRKINLFTKSTVIIENHTNSIVSKSIFVIDSYQDKQLVEYILNVLEKSINIIQDDFLPLALQDPNNDLPFRGIDYEGYNNGIRCINRIFNMIKDLKPLYDITVNNVKYRQELINKEAEE